MMLRSALQQRASADNDGVLQWLRRMSPTKCRYAAPRKPQLYGTTFYSTGFSIGTADFSVTASHRSPPMILLTFSPRFYLFKFYISHASCTTARLRDSLMRYGGAAGAFYSPSHFRHSFASSRLLRSGLQPRSISFILM